MSLAAVPVGDAREAEDTGAQQAARVIIKRFAHREECVIYRYGSFSAAIEIVGQFPFSVWGNGLWGEPYTIRYKG